MDGSWCTKRVILDGKRCRDVKMIEGTCLMKWHTTSWWLRGESGLSIEPCIIEVSRTRYILLYINKDFETFHHALCSSGNLVYTRHTAYLLLVL